MTWHLWSIRRYLRPNATFWFLIGAVMAWTAHSFLDTRSDVFREVTSAMERIERMARRWWRGPWSESADIERHEIFRVAEQNRKLMIAYDLRDVEALREYAQFSFEQSVRRYGPNDPRSLTAAGNLAGLYVWDQDGSSEPLRELQLSQVFALVDSFGTSSDDRVNPSLIFLYANAGAALIERGDTINAGRLIFQADAWARARLSARHPIRLSLTSMTGDLYSSMGEHTRALETYTEVLNKRRAVLPELHSDIVAAREKIAGAMRNLGNLGEAIEILEKVVRERSEILGKLDRETLVTMNNLGVLYREAEKFDRAEDVFREVVNDRKAHNLVWDETGITSIENLALALVAQRKLTEARDVLWELIALLERNKGQESKKQEARALLTKVTNYPGGVP